MTRCKRFLREIVLFLISLAIASLYFLLWLVKADTSVYIYISLLIICILILVWRICCVQPQIPAYIARDVVVENIVSPQHPPVSTIIVIQQPDRQYSIGYLDRKISSDYSVENRSLH